MQPKREPVIFAGDMSNEELYSWIRAKNEAVIHLHALLHEKASLEKRLSEVDGMIEVVTLHSRLEIYPTKPDPTHLQDSQGSLLDIACAIPGSDIRKPLPADLQSEVRREEQADNH